MTGSLAAVSACAAQISGGGQFCDVVRGSIAFPAPVAELVVAEARDEAVRIDTQNRYGAANCPGWN